MCHNYVMDIDSKLPTVWLRKSETSKIRHQHHFSPFLLYFQLTREWKILITQIADAVLNLTADNSEGKEASAEIGNS